MDRGQTGDKPLHKAMLNQIYVAIWCIWAIPLQVGTESGTKLSWGNYKNLYPVFTIVA